MLYVPKKIRTKKYRSRRVSYAAATMWNAISDDGLKNSKHNGDLRKGLKTYISKKIFLFQYSTGLVYI